MTLEELRCFGGAHEWHPVWHSAYPFPRLPLIAITCENCKEVRPVIAASGRSDTSANEVVRSA